MTPEQYERSERTRQERLSELQNARRMLALSGKVSFVCLWPSILLGYGCLYLMLTLPEKFLAEMFAQGTGRFVVFASAGLAVLFLIICEISKRYLAKIAKEEKVL